MPKHAKTRAAKRTVLLHLLERDAVDHDFRRLVRLGGEVEHGLEEVGLGRVEDELPRVANRARNALCVVRSSQVDLSELACRQLSRAT